MEIFTLWSSERTRHVDMPPGASVAPPIVQLNEAPLAGSWAVEEQRWHRAARKGERQNAFRWYGAPCISAAAAQGLLVNRSGLELLPLRISGEDWFVVNVLGTVAGVDLASSESSLLPPKELQVRSFSWINLVHPQPFPYEFFHLREGSPKATYVTAAFVQRYKALKLKGLRFELIGHVIDSADHAVPKPPRPVKPEPAPGTHKQPKLSLKPLPKAWQQELRDSATEGAARLGLAADASGQTTLAALLAEIGRLRPAWSEELTEERVAPLMELSAVYGNLVCQRCGWRWMQLDQARGPQWMAVASPGGEHALPVVAYMNQQILRPEPTLVLLLNMIAARDLPPATPGQPAVVG